MRKKDVVKCWVVIPILTTGFYNCRKMNISYSYEVVIPILTTGFYNTQKVTVDRKRAWVVIPILTTGFYNA